MLNLCSNTTFYSVDKFQNICKSPYEIKKYHPINTFYFTYPRFETFYKNMIDNMGNNSVYAIRYDAYTILEHLKKIILKLI